MTEFKAYKMKSTSEDLALWYAETEHIHQCMQKVDVKEKSEADLIAQIMTQIPEEYKVATHAISSILAKYFIK